MLKSKYFWIAIVIVVPFIVLWIMEGIGWAIATFVLVGIFFLSAFLARSRRRRYHHYVDDYDYGDDRDINININYNGDRERKPRRPPHIPPVVPINPKGVKFITGDSKSFRKREQDAMRRMKKNLWG